MNDEKIAGDGRNAGSFKGDGGKLLSRRAR